jgi:cellulose synthase/poly-beta-1,6-N-acetylglucosamine synthase-like glycosyltransferase
VADGELPSVSVLLPVANGEAWVAAKLQSIAAMDYPAGRVTVLVGDDGSTDATEAIVQEFRRTHPNVQFFSLPKGGKARALNALMEHAQGDILFFTDVRQRLDRNCLRHLVDALSAPGIGGACGELIILDGHTEEEQSVGLYWKLEKWIRRQLSRRGTLLVVTGCLYAVRRSLAGPLPDDALGDDIFMPQWILRKGYRVVFEDRARAYDYPTTMDVEFRRKIRTLAGLYQYIGRHGLGPYPGHFFSYKVSRLLLPWALLAVAAATPFLPFPAAVTVGAAQAAFYAAALLDPAIRNSSPLKRISSPARAFCMLMMASLFSVSVLFRPAESLWKTTSVRAPRTSAEAARRNV